MKQNSFDVFNFKFNKTNIKGIYFGRIHTGKFIYFLKQFRVYLFQQ